MVLNGCGKPAEQVTYQKPYDIYETSSQYGMLLDSEYATHNMSDLFSVEHCVATGEDIGTKETASHVVEASGVFNVTRQEVTYSKNIYEKIYPASTTKILTALLAIENGNLDQSYIVSENAVNQASDSSVCNLHAGDQITLRQLLYGLMLRSGNDAAVAIAEAVSGDIESFAKLMNERARTIGAFHSHFVNPNGLHDEEHYTTVYDMYRIFEEALKNEEFRNILTTQMFVADYTDSAGMPVHQEWQTTNKYLLNLETAPEGITVLGGKTGTTNPAGYCLVLLSKNSSEEEIISIVMKADCRYNLYYFMNQILNGYAK